MTFARYLTTGIDQMILLEELLWGTASAITTNICLTKD